MESGIRNIAATPSATGMLGDIVRRDRIMAMLDLSEIERKNYRERHALDTDSEGNEVFAGLSRDESLALLGHIRMNSLPVRAANIRQERDVQKHGIALREKHENARLKAQWAAQGNED